MPKYIYKKVLLNEIDSGANRVKDIMALKFLTVV